jgi:spore coat polysaccharide biosynthesis protein SpsF (cytidylyltransferase family)
MNQEKLLATNNVAVMIQARVGSKRFPKKVLAKIENKPMIWHVINRIKSIKSIRQVILLTTKRDEDEILLRIANSSGVIGFAGNTYDVLKRYYRCAKKYNVDTIVRITGDCPLIDPDLVKKMLNYYSKNNFDYLSNTLIPTFPDGLDVEIFSFKTLEIMNKNAKLPSEREHVTAYIRNHRSKFRIFNLKNVKDLSDFRWTVDEPRDLQFVRKIYSEMRPKLLFSTKDVLRVISKNPEIVQINKEIVRNEGYLISLKKDKKKTRR